MAPGLIHHLRLSDTEKIIMSKTKASVNDSKETSIAGLRHLDQASQLFLATSPALSAYLGSQRIGLSSAFDIRTDTANNGDRTCISCGYALIPGWSCKISRTTQRSKATKRQKKPKKHMNDHRAPGSAGESRLKCECLKCHSVIHFGIPRKPAKPTTVKPGKPAVKSAVEAPTASIAPTVADVQSIATTTAVPEKEATSSEMVTNTKKRPRKPKHTGLQALLAKSKTGTSSPSGFDLMDFMKSV